MMVCSMKRRTNVVFNGGSASARFAVRGSDSNFPEPGERATPSLTGDAMSLVEQERRLLVRALENQRQPDSGRPTAPHHARFAAL